MVLQLFQDKSNPNTACQRQCNSTEFLELTSDMMKCWTVCPSGFIDTFIPGRCIPQTRDVSGHDFPWQCESY